MPQLKSTLTVASTELDHARKRIVELEAEIKTLREQLATFEQDAVQSRQIAETVKKKHCFAFRRPVF